MMSSSKIRANTNPFPTVKLAHVVAVTGCDGSGKSTLSNDLYSYFKTQGEVQLIYLGQSSGNIGQWIKNLAFIGPSLGKFLQRKAQKAHSKKNARPDTATIIVIYLLSSWRLHKFKRMLKLSRKGITIITDRYPQAEVAGFYFDGTGLGAMETSSWVGKKLAARELRHYQWMAAHVPGLVFRLNIDEKTAHSRKPDHKLSMLRQKIAVIPTLNFNHADIQDLDSCSSYEKVLKQALQITEQTLKK